MACREVLAGASEHRDAHGVVLCEPLVRVIERDGHLGVLRVANFGAVQRDDCGGAALFVQNGCIAHVRHWTSRVAVTPSGSSALRRSKYDFSPLILPSSNGKMVTVWKRVVRGSGNVNPKNSVMSMTLVKSSRITPAS